MHAKDEGTPTKFSTSTVYIFIADINDNVPVFDRDLYSVNVMENATVGTFVGKLDVHDADKSKIAIVIQIEVCVIAGSTFTYNILSGDPYNRFSINSTGALFVNGVLDRETAAVYDLAIGVTDQSPSLHTFSMAHTAQTDVRVTLDDINDTPPTFTSSQYITINGSTPIGSTVHQLRAIDPDEGYNGYVEYRLDGATASGQFAVNSVSGAVVVNGGLSGDTRLDVVAYDRGYPMLESMQTVYVRVVGAVKDVGQPKFAKSFVQVFMIC